MDLNERIVSCERCPRLIAYIRESPLKKPRRFADQEYWAKPLPGFGDPKAERPDRLRWEDWMGVFEEVRAILKEGR